jgi:hypothetical protein
VDPARRKRSESKRAFARTVLDALSSIGVVAAWIAASLDGDGDGESGEDGEDLHCEGSGGLDVIGGDRLVEERKWCWVIVIEEEVVVVVVDVRMLECDGRDRKSLDTLLYSTFRLDGTAPRHEKYRGLKMLCFGKQLSWMPHCSHPTGRVVKTVRISHEMRT